MVMICQRLSGMKGRQKYDVFYPVICSQGFLESEHQQVKKRERMSSCSAGVKLCSINLSLRTGGGGTDWTKKVLLANVKKL